MGKGIWQSIGWCVISVILLLSLLTPFIVFTISFVMIPVLMIYVKQDIKRFTIYYLAILLFVYITVGVQGTFPVIVSLFFLPPVIVMGNLYKKKAAAKSVVTAGILAILACSLALLVIGYSNGFNVIAKFKHFMNDYLITMTPALKVLLPTDQDGYINLMVQVIPLDLILFSLYYVFITHGIGRKLLSKSGISLPSLPPLREWMLPKTFVWIYLASFMIDLFMDPFSGSFLTTLLLNLLPLLMIVFAIQAISFLFYVAHANHWNKLLPILGVVVLILFLPLLLFVYSLLGVFDVAFPIRERFKKKL